MPNSKSRYQKIFNMLKEENVYSEEIEMFYPLDLDTPKIIKLIEKANERCERVYLKDKEIDNNNKKIKLLQKEIFDEYKRVIENKRIKTAQEVIVYETEEVYEKEYKTNIYPCYALKLSVGDYIVIEEPEITDKATDLGLSKDEYLYLLNSFKFKKYDANSLKYQSNRFHRFKSISDAAKWMYEREKGIKIDNLDAPTKAEHMMLIKNKVCSRLRDCIKNKDERYSYNGYIIIRVSDLFETL